MFADVKNDVRRDIYARLMAYSQGKDNDDVLACILSTWQSGGCSLPEYVGLGQFEFEKMIGHHFPGFLSSSLSQPDKSVSDDRVDEINDVRKLLADSRVGNTYSERWVAQIVAVACQGNDHLWQDLGLWSRKDLSELLMRNFSALAMRNDKDMKWKKFLYKQLCETEGIYTCRSPSCEVCAEYNDCFGPEE